MNNADKQAVTAIRVLSAEAVEQANSGHPGLPMGSAPMAFELWARHLKHNPKNPNFFNRDRFVLSAGHGSMLLYSLLHLFGYGITKEDLMSFRQLASKTAGHPEYGVPGVETSTGPLGQGVANAVGFALAEKILAARFNKPGMEVVDHYTYALAGDGCMMEGIEAEAASLAGTWGLNKLIMLYDSNGISIEGKTTVAFREDVGKRHEAQGWQVLTVDDGEDLDAVGAAIEYAKTEKNKPTLIIVKTTIGFGSPKAGSADCHGAPLGKDAFEKTKKNLGWDENLKPFELPGEVVKYMAEITEDMPRCEAEWNKTMRQYKAEYPEAFEEFNAFIKGKIPDLTAEKEIWKFTDKPDATRNAGGTVLNRLIKFVPNLVGGSADLGPSNKTYMKDRGDFSKETPAGLNLHFGVREHAMAAITNGLQLHGGFNAFCATFFVFSDYMKNAVRMSALMGLPVTYVLTHDSIGVGEDGPTHQPVEQLAGLRSVPELKVFRPCDGRETAAAYVSAIGGKQPTAIVLSRQNLPQFKGTGVEALKGGYILSDCKGEVPSVILMASGSEVQLAMEAQARLAENKIDARVVSMPCMELFEAQPLKYREAVLPSSVRARVAIEAGSSMPWGKYVGLDGTYVCMDGFGASAPADTLFEIYGFNVENVVKQANKAIRNCKAAAKQ